MNWARIILSGVLLLILGTQLPIFLQMTLTPDAVLYDVQTRCLLEGGVLYRDVVEPNLPGVVWVHALVRSIAGWSPMALRGFDLVVVFGIALLLSRFVTDPLASAVQRTNVRGIFLCGIFWFYFSTSEWCHCQRDTWMLLPCLLATTVRWRVMKQLPTRQMSLNPTMHVTSIVAWGILEGAMWALGFWLKPFVAIPALAVMLGSKNFFAIGLHRAKTPSSGLSATFSPSQGEKGQWDADEVVAKDKRWHWMWFVQVGSVVAGGLITGGIGILWMMNSGCWPHFLEMLTEWNGDYFQSGRSRWTIELYFFHAERFWPWVLLHVPAIFISLRAVWKNLRSVTGLEDPSPIAVTLLRSLYLGWIIQAFALQQMFDYIHVPGVMLAFAVCVQASARVLQNSQPVVTAITASRKSLRSMITPVAVAFAGLCLVSSPLFRRERQQHWIACVQACLGSPLAPHMRDELALCPFPRWTELQPLLDRMEEMAIPDGSVMAYNGNSIHLYPALHFRSPTRFVYLDVLARCFPQRKAEMLAELQKSGVGFVLSNLMEDGWDGDLPVNGDLPEFISDRRETIFFPYNQTPVLRSGSYVLFAIDRPLGWLTSELGPLSRQSITKLPQKTSKSTELRNSAEIF